MTKLLRQNFHLVNIIHHHDDVKSLFMISLKADLCPRGKSEFIRLFVVLNYKLLFFMVMNLQTFP